MGFRLGLAFLGNLEEFDDSVISIYIFLAFSNGIFSIMRMKPFDFLEIDP